MGVAAATMTTLAASACVPSAPPNDTQELLSMIDSARTSGKPLVLESQRTYGIDRTLDVSGLEIQGSSAALRPHSGPLEQGLLVARDSLALFDLTVGGDGVGDALLGPGLTFLVSESGPRPRLRVDGCTFDKLGDAGILVRSDSGTNNGAMAPPVDGVLSGSTIRGCRYGVRVNRVSGMKFRALKVSGSEVNGLHLDLAGRSVIEDCQARENGGHGIVLLYSSGSAVRHCRAEGNGRGGITFGGGRPDYEPTVDAVAVRNTCSGNALNGISLDTTLEKAPGVPVPMGAVVRDNVCENNKLNGINVNCSSDVKLTGNTCSGNQNGIGVSSWGATLSNNTCVGNRVSGIALFGSENQTLYGGHTVLKNDVSDNEAGGYRVAWQHLQEVTMSPSERRKVV